MQISKKDVNNLKRFLNQSGHWYIVTVNPAWNHPANKVPNCLAILFDGSINLKCETLPDGNLRVAQLPYDDHFLHVTSMGLRIDDVISVRYLCEKIWQHPFKLGNGVVVGRKYVQNMQSQSPVEPKFYV